MNSQATSTGSDDVQVSGGQLSVSVSAHAIASGDFVFQHCDSTAVGTYGLQLDFQVAGASVQFSCTFARTGDGTVQISVSPLIAGPPAIVCNPTNASGSATLNPGNYRLNTGVSCRADTEPSVPSPRCDRSITATGSTS